MRRTLLLMLLAVGCRSLLEPDFVRSERIDVAPVRVACEAPFPTMCYQTRPAGTTAWTLFSGDIEGFTFAQGYLSTLDVDVYRVRNPPQDAPGQRTVLRRLVRREWVGIS